MLFDRGNEEQSSPVLQGSVSETANAPSDHPVWSALGRVAGATASTLANMGQQYLEAYHPIDWDTPPYLPQPPQLVQPTGLDPAVPSEGNGIAPHRHTPLLQPLQTPPSFITPPLAPLKPVTVPTTSQQTDTLPGRLDTFPPYQPNPNGFNPAAQQHTDAMLSYLPNQPLKAAGLIAQSQHYANNHTDDMVALIHNRALTQMTDSLNAMPAANYKPQPLPQPYTGPQYLPSQTPSLQITSEPNLSATDVPYRAMVPPSGFTSSMNIKPLYASHDLRAYAKPLNRPVLPVNNERTYYKKSIFFPTNPHLSLTQYPDVTTKLIYYRDNWLKEARHVQKQYGQDALLRLFIEKFPPRQPWDTKSNSDLPGIDRNGNEQYAFYKGKVVPASYIANNLYGQILAGTGFSLVMAKTAAQLAYKKSVNNIFTHDQPTDQWAIMSGYYDYWYKNPWINGGKPVSQEGSYYP